MNWLREYWAALRAKFRFPGYLPQPVTVTSFLRWLRQFNPEDRAHLLRLLDSVVYLKESDVRDALVSLNSVILKELKKDGIPIEKVIYVSLHDAGSSSGVMLNMLRDFGRLARTGCHFIDSNNVLELNKLTDKIEEGAIIYVDDFAGTGTQFYDQRKFIAEYILGNFSEFFLVPGVCEEAIFRLGEIGVRPLARVVHPKAARPLHPQSDLLPDAVRARLLELCSEINPRAGLGFGSIASMVILYRNSPNTTPLILRGSLRQSPKVGLFPRSDDLPELA